MIKWLEHPEYDAFLKRYVPGHTEIEITRAFMQKFGILLTPGRLGNRKTKLGLKSGTKGGQFPKGLVPWNKGKKMAEDVYARCKPTMFTKGTIPPNYRPEGSTRISRDGYFEIKIADPNKWQLMQRYVWEKSNNRKLSRNECIIFLDGNKLNFDPDNLQCVTRAELVRINQNHRLTDNAEVSKAGVCIEKLKERIRRFDNG